MMHMSAASIDHPVCNTPAVWLSRMQHLVVVERVWDNGMQTCFHHMACRHCATVRTCTAFPVTSKHDMLVKMAILA